MPAWVSSTLVQTVVTAVLAAVLTTALVLGTAVVVVLAGGRRLLRRWTTKPASETAMHSNRIRHHLNRLAMNPATADVVPAGISISVGSASGHVFVPMAVHPATWQAQLYRMAYEQALVDLAPPGHHRRFFSSWN